MLCQHCGAREAEVRLTELMDSAAAERQLCHVCAGGHLQAFEEDLALRAHMSLPDGPALDAALARVARDGTPSQRRQIALMLKARADREPSRLTPSAVAFLNRFGPPPEGERRV